MIEDRARVFENALRRFCEADETVHEDTPGIWSYEDRG
jgi:hypothetical protein